MSPKKPARKASAAKRTKKPAKARARSATGKKTTRTAARTTPERVKVGGLRTLGDVEPSRDRPASSRAASAKKARTVLEQEFARALELKEKLAAEAAIGGREKGREASRQQEKLRSIINSLEGMNRFALQMGLITPAESRELYADAMKQGLYEGWTR